MPRLPLGSRAALRLCALVLCFSCAPDSLNRRTTAEADPTVVGAVDAADGRENREERDSQKNSRTDSPTDSRVDQPRVQNPRTAVQRRQSPSSSSPRVNDAPTPSNDNQGMPSADSRTPVSNAFSTDGSMIPSPAILSSRCYRADPFACEVEAKILQYTNQVRGNGALGLSPQVSFVARLWSAQQAVSGRLSHDGFPGARVAAYTREFGVQPRLRAENVAYASVQQPTADAVARQLMDLWWESTGHRRNLLGPFGNVGIGVHRIGDRFYGTQIFLD